VAWHGLELTGGVTRAGGGTGNAKSGHYLGDIMSDRDHGHPADEQQDAPRPSWPDGSTYSYPLPFPLAQAVDDEEIEPGVGPAAPPYGSHYPWPPAPAPAWLRDRLDAGDTADPGGGRGHARRSWLVPAGLVTGAAVLGAAAVLMTGGHPSAPGSRGLASPSVKPSMAVVRVSKSPAPSTKTAAPLTLTQAQAVLATYTTVNNSANAQRSDAKLATVESGSSDAIDVGLYQEQHAAGTAPYPAFGPVQATYYIPRNEPAGGPRWFVVQVANAFKSSPAMVTSDEYLLFTQSAPGGTWRNAIEPYLLPSASAPRVEVGADGLATAVSPDATSVTVAPGQVPAATAASLDGTGARQDAVADPGNLADRAAERHWQATVTGGTVTDTHTAAAGADGQEFALLTADGGALVFYTDAAELTITPPAGSVLHLTVPGFYSPAQAVTRATVMYLEQFAAYDPPSGGGAPGVVADYSGITGAN